MWLHTFVQIDTIHITITSNTARLRYKNIKAMSLKINSDILLYSGYPGVVLWEMYEQNIVLI